MYIGSADGNSLHHMVWEVVDVVDEALSGFGSQIPMATINKDGSLSVEDLGTWINRDACYG